MAVKRNVTSPGFHRNVEQLMNSLLCDPGLKFSVGMMIQLPVRHYIFNRRLYPKRLALVMLYSLSIEGQGRRSRAQLKQLEVLTSVFQLTSPVR